MLQSLPMIFVLAGLILYTVLGGADFGGGFWQLTAGRGTDGERVREYAHRAMGPVWEANHVWLVFVLTVFWTAYPEAFGSIASTLIVPLTIALLGILLRGTAYAAREGARTPKQSARLDTLFALSSILVPFALGAAVGAIATDRVPVGNAAGELWASWLNSTSIMIGLIAVASSAYLAAVYLAADAARDSDTEMESAFHARSLEAGVVAGGLAITGLVVANADSHTTFHSLLSGRAASAVIVSALAGVATLALVHRRRYEPARYAAAVAVAAVIVGWALSRWPTILPGLTVHQAAAGHDALVALVAVVACGGLIIFPALVVLFRLTLAGRFRDDAREVPHQDVTPRAHAEDRTLMRWAIALLIAGAALLNGAETAWAHATGVVCLIGFMVVGFGAIVLPTLDEHPAAP